MNPYWLDAPHTPTHRLERDLQVDVAIIGGGLCGVSTAWHLSQQGVQVALLEANTLASSATGRNAGFILQGTAERYDRAVEVMGRARARAVHAHSVDNHTQMAQAIQTLSIDCDYQQRGSLQLASSEQETRELRSATRLLIEDGFEAKLLAHQALPSILQPTHRLGVFMPSDGEVNPARFTRGLALAAQQAGAQIFEGSRAAALDTSSPGQARVHLAHGPTVSASLVVLATNARAGDLSEWLSERVDPVRGQMLATEPLPQRFPWPIYANHGYDYWRQTPSGRVVLGGWRNLDPATEVGHKERLHPGIQERMAHFLRSFGWTQTPKISHQWSGTMGFSRDGLPLVGALPGQPAAVCGVGFTGHGFGFAFLAGAALAALVTEGSHPLCSDLDPRRLS